MKPAKKILTKAGLHNTFWGQIIIKTEAKGPEYGYNMIQLNLGKSWLTCACGKLDERIPRHEHSDYAHMTNRPKDRWLEHWGGDFYDDALNQNNHVLAAHLLVKIEKRACKIINKLEEKHNEEINKH